MNAYKLEETIEEFETEVNKLKSINEIHNLFNERRKYYLHYHLKVNCDYLSANKIADEIIRQLKTDKV